MTTSSRPVPATAWPQALLDLLASRAVIVRVVLAGLRGSAPREAGATMLVSANGSVGSIGGGHLEWEATQAARALLDHGGRSGALLRRRLGEHLAQCCGGVVDLWLERWTAADRPLLLAAADAAAGNRPQLLDSRIDADGRLHRQLLPAAADAPLQLARDDGDGSVRLRQRLDGLHRPLWLFGAGHVGQALAPILATLPFRLRWIDSRPGIFPAGLATGIETCVAEDPVALLAEARPAGHYLLMTHDHPLDYALCRALLQRGDAAFIGMIGSASKAARFRARLAREGLDGQGIACPVGIGGIRSKLPAAIAVSVAAQLLQGLDSPPPAAQRGTAADGCRLDQPQGCARCGSARAATATATVR